MRPPDPSLSDGAAQDSPLDASAQPASMLAVSGLLRVQRRWLLASRAGSSADARAEGPREPDGLDATGRGGAGLDATRRGGAGLDARRVDPAGLAVHLEDSEWSRLALGVAAEALADAGPGAPAGEGVGGVGGVAAEAGSPLALQLDPETITMWLASFDEPSWPFTAGPATRTWTMPRDSGIVAALSVTPATVRAARRAALVTLAEAHGRRLLIDLVAMSSTILVGPSSATGAKIAEVAVELATRRWSDLETLIVVGFGRAADWLGGAVHVPRLSAALDELALRSTNGSHETSVCVIVPPWASDPDDPLLAEVVRYCEQTPGVGVLSSASPEGSFCLWELGPDAPGSAAVTFGDGRRLSALSLAGIEAGATGVAEDAASGGGRVRGRELHARSSSQAPARCRTTPRLAPAPASLLAGAAAVKQSLESSLLQVSVLGSSQVSGAPESFKQRRRLTELVVFLAMHPEGATTDVFATALWPERRVPLQTIANRLSEARRALGLASDGRPRLRKNDKRHLIVEFETDWDRFRDLASEGYGADSWRRALELVRGRPFDGLEQGGWAQLDGFVTAVEASVVGIACRLGEHSLGRAQPDLAHWAALKGLLVSPWDERLYRLLMRAEDGLGNRGGIDAALRNLALVLELEGDPLLGVHPETADLYRALTSPNRTAAG